MSAGAWGRTALAGLTFALLSAPVAAQAVRSDPQEEGRRLRDAAARESRGDHAGAERVLVGVLEGSPASSAALFALERVLRAQGRVAEILPAADRFLEVEPESGGVRYLKLRVLVEVDSLDTLEDEADRWLLIEPDSPEAYRELAKIYERAYGPDRALAFFDEARAALGDPAALAVERGDLLARHGRASEAVGEWSRAVGDDSAQLTLVLRRLSELPEGSRDVTRLLLAALDEEPTTSDRRRAAVRIALESGLHDDALDLARRAAEALPEQGRRTFLSDLTRRGEELRAFDLALWAYERLRDEARDPAEVRTLNQRIAGVALAAGDSARAAEAQRLLVESLGRGSPERLRAMMELIRLEASAASPERMTTLLEEFRREFPDSPELDDLASTVAAGLQAQGHTREASTVLEGVSGPRSALERAYLLFGEGRIEEGEAALSNALPGLAPERATEAIQLLSLLAQAGPRGAEALAGAAVLEHGGDPAGAAAHLEERLAPLPDAEQAAVLAQAARLREVAGEAAPAAELRRRLLAEHPLAPEAAEAMLALARHEAGSPDGLREAVALLERLILERPASPVVPDARRELQRLRTRLTGGRAR